MRMSYAQYEKEHRKLLKKIPSKRIYAYMLSNLKASLASIGFSEEFINFFTSNFSKLEFKEFYKKFEEEIKNVYSIGFFQKIVPDYFSKEVIPHIPKSNKILDIGCGTGILIHRLAHKKKFKKLVGIDIHEYPEWRHFKSSKAQFKIVKETAFRAFLKKTQPDNLLLTWTLHHMNYNEQARYLSNTYSLMKTGSRMIILEDSYAENLSPRSGKNTYASFMKLSTSERKVVMSTYDWIANRILARRKNVPIPFGYRTLEEWENLCKAIGYKIVKKVFIGFPANRDINTPQSLLIAEK